MPHQKATLAQYFAHKLKKSPNLKLIGGKSFLLSRTTEDLRNAYFTALKSHEEQILKLEFKKAK